MAKSKNPFAGCTTFAEVFKIIRRQCEKIRGKPYRTFRISNAFIDDKIGRFSFYLETEYTNFGGTKDGDLHHNLSWRRLITGDDTYLYAKAIAYSRYDGEAFRQVIGGGGGGSGSKRNTVNYHGQIMFKHLPLIYKEHKKNLKKEEVEQMVFHRPYPYTPEDRTALLYVELLNSNIAAWRANNAEAYRLAHPLHDLWKGTKT